MQQWRYVPTRENPADGASRGLNAARVHSGSCWFQGPPFLWQNENNWPGVKGVEVEVLRDDPELRRKAKSYATFVHEDIVAGFEEKISSWPTLKRIDALVLCFKKKVLDCIKRNRSTRELNPQGSIVCGWNKNDGEGDNQICAEKTLWRRINLSGKSKMLEVMQQHSKVRSIH